MSRTPEEIQAWIIDRVGTLIGIDPSLINPSEPVLRYGLDSVTLVVIAGDLEDWLGYRFRANPFEEHPTIEALSRYLAEETARPSR